MGELLAHMVIRTESTVNGWGDALATHLPKDPTQALIVTIIGCVVALVASAYTVTPLCTWLIAKPIEWCKRGKPLLPIKCESRDTFLVD